MTRCLRRLQKSLSRSLSKVGCVARKETAGRAESRSAPLGMRREPKATRMRQRRTAQPLRRISAESLWRQRGSRAFQQNGAEGQRLLRRTENRAGANIHFGIREFAMAAICNGIQLYGGFRAYLRDVPRVYGLSQSLRCGFPRIMHQPVVYVMTHDSIGVGEDGPTHQPIEHLAALRATPGVLVFRPADAKETAYSYIMAFEADKPSVLALTRQNLPQYAETGEGAYQGRLYPEGREKRQAGCHPDGERQRSRAHLQGCRCSWKRRASKHACRLHALLWISSTSRTQATRKRCCRRSVRARVAVEAGSAYSWDRYVGLDGTKPSASTTSAHPRPPASSFKEFGFTVENVVASRKGEPRSAWKNWNKSL